MSSQCPFPFLAGFEQDDGKFITICDGVHMLTANIIIQGTTGDYELAVTFGDGSTTTVATTAHQATDRTSTMTLSIYKAFSVAKGTHIQLSITTPQGAQFTVLKYSTWSMAYIGERGINFREFSSFLQQDRLYQSSINQAFLNQWYPVSRYLTGETTNGQFFSPSDLTLENNFERFSVPFMARTDLFYVNLVLHVVGPATKIEVLITVSRSTSDLDLSGDAGLYGSFTKLANRDAAITLAGIMEIRNTQYINILVRSKERTGIQFTVQKESFVSIVNMRYTVSSVGTKLSQNFPVSTAAWTEMSGPWANYGNGMYRFGQDFVTENGRFVASHSGVHLVLVNINFDSVTSSMIEATVAIDGNPDPSLGLYSVAGEPQSRQSLHIYGAIVLRAGQYVSVFVKSKDTDYSIQSTSGFSVSYVGPKYYLSSIFAVKTAPETVTDDLSLKSISGWTTENKQTTFKSKATFDGTTFTSTEDGIYIVAANIVLEDIDAGAPGDVTIEITVDSRPVGISDLKKGYDTVSDDPVMSLHVVSSVKLDRNRVVEVKVKCQVDQSYIISDKSSFSIIRWSNAVNPTLGPFNLEQLRNVGIFGNLQADTAYFTSDSFNVWNRLGRNTFRHTTTTSYPGLFYVGKTFNPENIDFTVVEPAIFFISASVNFDSAADTGTYEVSVQIGSNDVDNGLYAVKVNPSNQKFTLTVAGTLYLTAGQRVRIVTRGTTFHLLREFSSFSMVKLQPDYHTPGFISDGALTFPSGTGQEFTNLPWSAHTHIGLTVR